MMRTKKLKRVSIAIDQEIWAKIIAIANVHDRSTSQYVRLVLRDHLESIGINIKKGKK